MDRRALLITAGICLLIITVTAPGGEADQVGNSPEKGTDSQKTALTAEDVLSFFSEGAPSCAAIRERLGKKSLPLLHSMLSDAKYMNAWNNIWLTIGILGGDENSTEVILNYIKRDDFRRDLKISQCVKLWMGKARAFRMLGLLPGEEKQEILRQVITDGEYLQQLTHEWIRQPLPSFANMPGRGEEITMIARGAAAEGLLLMVTSRETANKNLELVQSARKKALEEYLDCVKRNAEANELFRTEQTYGTYIWAIAQYNLMNEIGVEKLLDLTLQDSDLQQYMRSKVEALKEEDGTKGILGR